MSQYVYDTPAIYFFLLIISNLVLEFLNLLKRLIMTLFSYMVVSRFKLLPVIKKEKNKYKKNLRYYR